jgi:hypothetical protein
MAYGGPSWISPYHYGKLLNNAIFSPATVGVDSPWWKDKVWEEWKQWPWLKFPPPPPPWWLELPMFPPDYPLERVISVIARIERGNVAEVLHVARTSVRTHLDQAKRTELVASLRGAEGAMLAQAPLLRLERQPMGCGSCGSDVGGAPASYLAQAFIPDVAPGEALEIRDGDKLLWRREAPHKPARIKAFNAKLAKRGKSGEVLQLDWRIDGFAEELWVRWSTDGETWRSLTTGLSGETAEIDAPMLPAGKVRLQLVAHDGFFSDFSKPFSLAMPERPPAVSILHPTDGYSYQAGHAVRLWGAAASADAKATDPAQALWVIGKKRIAEGLDAWTTFEPGEHVLKLEVETRAGKASAQVKIKVTEAPKDEP